MRRPLRSVAPGLSATDPTGSAWVSASAGSGKTYVLIRRVLRMLLGGAAPERIVCLTFTKAAAAEMANRLHEALSTWAVTEAIELDKLLHDLTGRQPEDEEMARARRLFARVLEAPGGLKVQTIHAFCESLLGRFPLEAGLPPHFEVADERDAAELMNAARDRVLADAVARGDEAVFRLAGFTEETGVADLFRMIASERGRMAALFANPLGARRMLAGLRQRLGLTEGEDAESILHGLCADGAFDADGLRAVAEAMRANGGRTDGQKAETIGAWLQAKAALRDLDSYYRAFLTGKGAPFARATTKAVLQAMPEAEAVLRGEAERLVAGLERLSAAQVLEATGVLAGLAGGFLERYEAAKIEHALLDYDDLILRTCGLLARAGLTPWVLYKLDGGIDHLLVDEAQDTNPEQWQVVRALSEEFFAGRGRSERPRTVFAVGDPKQSIYSFQRADPRGFLAMREHFEQRAREAEQGWALVPLSRSYRSAPSVLRFVDALFAQAGAADGLFLDRPLAHQAHLGGHAGLVELWPLERPAEQATLEPWSLPVASPAAPPPKQRLAVRLAETVRGWVADGARLEAEDRPVRYGDILILVQRRSDFVDTLVRELKARGVPVAGVDRLVLTEQLAVQDLMALGHALLLPQDDLTLAVVLKGPLIGLDEEALYELARAREGSLWAELKRRADESPEFRQAHERLAGWLARIDYETPFAFYAGLLGADGGRRQLLERLGADAADPIEEFLNLARRHGREHVPSLQRFLGWLAAGGAEVKRDQEQRPGEVRIMTVHGAKGLQAPIVILPDTTVGPKEVPPTQQRNLFWLEDGEGFVWVPRSGLDTALTAGLRDAAAEARAQERRRLLYVAMTRAQYRLYICGWLGGNRSEAPDGSWYELAERTMGEIGETVQRGGDTVWQVRNPQSAEVAPPDAETVERVAELPAWAGRPAPPEPVPPRPLVPSRPDEAEPPVRQPLGGDDGAATRRGVLVHRLLQGLPELSESARAEAAARYLESAAADLPSEARAAIAAEVLEVLQGPRFAGLFGPDSLAEVPLAGVAGGQAVAGQIDRLVVRPESVLVVDYKTNRAPPESPEAVPTAYLRQMAIYRAVLAQIFPGRAVVCALLWTDGTRIMELPVALLDAHTP